MTGPEITVGAKGKFGPLYSDMSKAEARFGALGSKAKTAITGAALAGTAALVKMGIESVKASSAAEQSLGATETVFGRYADTVIRRSRQAADAVGLSANEYRELANVTGGMLQNAGTPLKKVTDLTAQLTKRAADMAATYGGSTKEAIEAVSSLLRGEADPIERYGVSIKQSDVNARLAAKGLDKLTGSALKQAEQQARLELLFKQTGKTAGQFGREADTIAGKGQRLGAKVEDLEAKFGDLLIPALAAAADWADDQLVPALDDLADWLGENSDEFADLGNTIKDTLLPPLQAGVELAGNAVEIFGDLPGPVKEIAAQAGVAALVLPRMAAGVNLVTSSTSAMVGNLRNAETRTAGLMQAAKTAAGIGGMLALTQGANSSNDAISTLSTTAGGAALGFSLGGPWGAAIGAVGGLVTGLVQLGDQTETTSGIADRSRTTWESYRDTLNTVTGATTAATKAMVVQDLQQSGLLNKAADIGVSQRTLVAGILGQAKAREVLSRAVLREQGQVTELVEKWRQVGDEKGFGSDEAKALEAEITRRQDVINAIKDEAGELRNAARARAEEIAVLRNVPAEVVTKIQTPGAVESARDVAKLADQYGLTPRQIQTVIELGKLDTTKAQVLEIQRRLFGVTDQKPSPRWQRELEQGLTGGRDKSSRGAKDINALLGAVGNVKPNLAPFGRGLSGQLGGLKTQAAGGARSVGDAMGAGMYQGLGTWIDPISGRAASMVRGAISAANAAGAIHSPSLETDYTGRMLGEGLAQGITGMYRTVVERSTNLGKGAVTGIARGVTGGLSGVDNALSQITKLVEKGIKGKNERQREKAYLKSLREEYAALRANGKAQDALASGNYLPYLKATSKLAKDMRREGIRNLEEARNALKAAKDAYDDYVRSIKDAVTATGDLTQMGRQDDGTVSLTKLVDDATQAATRAERFDFLMQKLAKDGLSEEQINRMLAAGPDAALATAEAIAAGGQSAIKNLNDLQARITAAGDRLSKAMAAKYKQAGVDAIQGIVTGLLSQEKFLEQAAVRMADVLIKAVKRRLRSNSPSKEFEDIADDVTDGLTWRLDANNTYVKRSGVGMATALVKGFDNPQLAADVLTSRAGAGGVGTVAVQLTAEQLDALEQGRRIQMKLDYARSNGVLGTTF